MCVWLVFFLINCSTKSCFQYSIQPHLRFFKYASIEDIKCILIFAYDHTSSMVPEHFLVLSGVTVRPEAAGGREASGVSASLVLRSDGETKELVREVH